MSDAVIEVDDLRRSYQHPDRVLRRTAKVVEAVRGVDFSVQRGELFGLLGPNGAGKTTTIKMLITLLLPTSGSARVLGYDVVDDAREVRKRVGYVFGGERGLYERLSALRQPALLRRALRACPRASSPARIGELLELVGLTGREKERVEGYSRGMRQRLHIARGLLHKPEVLFLDEPSIGIDPVGARELRSTVAGLVEQGTTVLLTTHYMFEADELCDRIAVITGGRIVATGTPGRAEGQGRGGRRSSRSRSSATPSRPGGWPRRCPAFGRPSPSTTVTPSCSSSGPSPGPRSRRPCSAAWAACRSAGSPPASPPWRTPTSSW